MMDRHNAGETETDGTKRAVDATLARRGAHRRQGAATQKATESQNRRVTLL